MSRPTTTSDILTATEREALLPRARRRSKEAATASGPATAGSRMRWTLLCGLAATVPLAAVAAWLATRPAPAPGLVTVTAVATAAAWLLAWWLVGRRVARLSRHLEQLDGVCRQVGDDWRYGRDTVPRPARAEPEVRRLAQGIEHMMRHFGRSQERLRSALAEAEDLRAELEAVVASRDEEIRTRTEELEEANLDLERLAREDGLTGIANHRCFIEFAEQCWRICTRERQPMALLMADVDRFKAYNDIYGHQAGDQCLKRVSRAVAGIARRALDLAARYGGEEFAVVLGNVELDTAVNLAEQARRAVETLRIPHSGSSEHGVVTISIGVAAVVPAAGVEVSTLIAMADRALYRAKRNGRNRTERTGGAGR